MRDPEVATHDPALALWSGEDGLDAMRVVEQVGARLLRPGGRLVAEHADLQGSSAPEVFVATGRWTEVADHPDLAGRDRYLTAVRDPARPRMARGRRYDMAIAGERSVGLDLARDAVRRGELVVLPTDTVYGVGTDAFSPDAVGALLAAKGRGRDMPVPVLVGSPRTLDGIATHLSSTARDLVEAFWPGGLTLVATVQPSLKWDLGETAGTVAVRMPLHPVAIALLQATGPMAVSSANVSGQPAATPCDEAVGQLGESVSVYLDGGPAGDPLPSTIVDVTGEVPRLLRLGAVDAEALREVAADLLAESYSGQT